MAVAKKDDAAAKSKVEALNGPHVPRAQSQTLSHPLLLLDNFHQAQKSHPPTMLSTKLKSAYQDRRQSRLNKEQTATCAEHHHRHVSETVLAAPDATRATHVPYADKVTQICQSMKLFGHLS